MGEHKSKVCSVTSEFIYIYILFIQSVCHRKNKSNAALLCSFNCLIFGIISPLVSSGQPDKYSYEILKPKVIYIKQHIS